jgi:hypothetical protein
MEALMSGYLESLPMMLTLMFGAMTMPDNAQRAGLTSPNSRIQDYAARVALRDVFEARTTRRAQQRPASAGFNKLR